MADKIPDNATDVLLDSDEEIAVFVTDDDYEEPTIGFAKRDGKLFAYDAVGAQSLKYWPAEGHDILFWAGKHRSYAWVIEQALLYGVLTMDEEGEYKAASDSSEEDFKVFKKCCEEDEKEQVQEDDFIKVNINVRAWPRENAKGSIGIGLRVSADKLFVFSADTGDIIFWVDNGIDEGDLLEMGESIGVIEQEPGYSDDEEGPWVVLKGKLNDKAAWDRWAEAASGGLQ